MGIAYSWCERRDLNPYESPHTPLKRARLPIPPLSRQRYVLYQNDMHLSIINTIKYFLILDIIYSKIIDQNKNYEDLSLNVRQAFSYLCRLLFILTCRKSKKLKIQMLRGLNKDYTSSNLK